MNAKILVACALVQLALALNLDEQSTPTVSQLSNELPSNKTVSLLKTVNLLLEEISNSGRTEASVAKSKTMAAAQIVTTATTESRDPVLTEIAMQRDQFRSKRSQADAKRWWCPLGQYSINVLDRSFTSKPSAGCQWCPAGKFQDIDKEFGSTCKNCGSGKYQSKKGKSSCDDKATCGAGTHVRLFGSSSSNRYCSTCAAGKFSKGNNLDSCTTCADGKYVSTPGASSCQAHTECVAGSFILRDGTESEDASCGACPAGLFTSGADEAQCKSCGQGKFSDLGSASCKDCPEGHSSEAGAAGCSTCEAGQFDSGDTCSACAAGQFQDAKGANHCTPCEEGSVAAEEGSVQCTPCTLGKHTTDGKTCVDNVCTCDHGTPATGAACFSNGVEICASCSGNRKLYNDECDGCKEDYVLQSGSCTAISSNCCTWHNNQCCGFNQNKEGTRHRMCKTRIGFWRRINECDAVKNTEENTYTDTGTCGSSGFRC